MDKLNANFIYFNFMIKVLVVFSALLIRIFFSNTMPISDMGLMYSLIGFFSLMTLFVNIGTQNSLQYFVPRLMVDKKEGRIAYLFQVNYLFQLGVLFIFSLGLFYLIPFLSENYFHQEINLFLFLFLIYFIFLNLLNPIRHIFISLKESKLFQLIKFFEITITFLFCYIFYIVIKNDLIYYYSISWILGIIFTLIIFIIILYKKVPYLFKKAEKDTVLIKKHFKYSIFLFSSGLGMLILNQIDIQIITFFLGFESVALYSNSFALVNTVVSFFAFANIILIPLISELNYKKKFEKLNRLLNLFFQLIFYLILPLSLILFLFSGLILKLIFGEQYVMGGEILSVFSFFLILKVIYMFNISFLNGIGKGKEIFKIIIPVAILNLILNIILIEKFEVMGVVYATIFSWFLLSILTYDVISNTLNFKINKFNFIKIIFLGIIFIFLVIGLKKLFVEINIFIASILILVISYGFYIVFGYLFKIYLIKDLYILIPNGKLKNKFKEFHKKYFHFIE